MRHEHVVVGHALRLRPIQVDDAAFVLRLRCDPTLNRYLHATAPDLQAQRQWLAAYEARDGDCYFVIEALADGSPQGLIAVYDIDPATRCGEWGRWMLLPGSMAAIESAWLVYRLAFETLGLAEVYCRTVADNQAVVSFHDSCHIGRRRLLPAVFELAGQRFDAVEHRVAADAWPALSARLEPLARAMAKKVQRALA